MKKTAFFLIFCLISFNGFSQTKISNHETDFTVLTQNLYLGSDFKSLLPDIDINFSQNLRRGKEKKSEMGSGMAEVFSEIVDTNFFERSKVLAQLIAQQRPHVISLQEVALFRFQFRKEIKCSKRGICLTDDIPATETIDTMYGKPFASDYLETLLKDLRKEGLNYNVAIKLGSVDIEAAIKLKDGRYADIRYTNHDVILTAPSVRLHSVTSAPYESSQIFISRSEKYCPFTFCPFALTKSWIRAELSYKGIPVTLVSTHLDFLSPILSFFQIEELTRRIREKDYTNLIVLGDFNSPAPISQSTYNKKKSTRRSLEFDRFENTKSHAYRYFLTDGFKDSYAEIYPKSRAGTALHNSDLRERACLGKNSKVHLCMKREGRIDHIFYKTKNKGLKVLDSLILNRKQLLRTPGGLWPSDHFGLLTRFSLR